MSKKSRRILLLMVITLLVFVTAIPTCLASSPAPSQIKSLPNSNMVCLTFDDGYGKTAITTILNCLRENNVQCTFFIIGSCLKKYPDLWRQAIADGHEIAYHTMTHSSLNRKSNQKIINDINKWNDLAHEILGEDYQIPKIARAPGGSANSRVRRLFESLGYSLIYWSLDTYTGVYKKTHHNVAQKINNYIVNKVKIGSIVLQHFNNYDAPSVSLYIQYLKDNFTLGKVSDALVASAANTPIT
ncbi:MAG: polysaccharide deacetylase family protein [Candidatus Shapirobacteria bacterium]|nr:polysaccharide deacetylase family protein [Candidatus Shapirobacteria bacterium]